MTASASGTVSAESILVANAGSSSLKFALYPVAGDKVGPATLTGVVEGLEPGGAPALSLRGVSLAPESHRLAVHPSESAFAGALRAAIDVLHARGDIRLKAVAHRVVHGGVRYSASVLVNDSVLGELQQLEPLAPLHQPHNLAVLRTLRAAMPAVPQVACFDTAFHAGAPEVEKRFALPEAYWGRGIRRYGFHGLSYRSVQHRLQDLTPAHDRRVLMAHLGNGASLCAAVDKRSVASTMGFSALDGLMMGTRCGALDAGVVLHLVRSGLSADALEDLLYRQSGLRGVSGIGADMRQLRSSDTEGARRAIAMFTYRVIREAGAMVACMGGLDVLSFSGGIGEHDACLRQEVCAALGFLGIALDEDANRQADGSTAMALHAPHSRAEVWLIPSDEGLMAAQDALALTTTVSRPASSASTPPARPVAAASRPWPENEPASSALTA